MDEETKKMLHLENDKLSDSEVSDTDESNAALQTQSSSASVNDEYIPGSEAPQIMPPPDEEPEESPLPEPKPKKKPKRKPKNPSYAFSSALTIVGIIAVAAFGYFLLTREVAIQAERDAIIEIQSSIESLYAKRDSLVTEYNSSIDIIDIRKRATQIGMHAPVEGQIIELGGN